MVRLFKTGLMKLSGMCSPASRDNSVGTDEICGSKLSCDLYEGSSGIAMNVVSSSFKMIREVIIIPSCKND